MPPQESSKSRPGPKPTVLLADDHPVMLETVSRLLSIRFEVIAKVGDGGEALALTRVLKPDIVVLDIEMPVLNGFQTALAIREYNLTSKIVFLTIHDDVEYRNSAREFGASGFVLKCRASSDLVPVLAEALAADYLPQPA